VQGMEPSCLPQGREALLLHPDKFSLVVSHPLISATAGHKEPSGSNLWLDCWLGFSWYGCPQVLSQVLAKTGSCFLLRQGRKVCVLKKKGFVIKNAIHEQKTI
jgi:hypothetical protein